MSVAAQHINDMDEVLMDHATRKDLERDIERDEAFRKKREAERKKNERAAKRAQRDREQVSRENRITAGRRARRWRRRSERAFSILVGAFLPVFSVAFVGMAGHMYLLGHHVDALVLGASSAVGLGLSMQHLAESATTLGLENPILAWLLAFTCDLTIAAAKFVYVRHPDLLPAASVYGGIAVVAAFMVVVNVAAAFCEIWIEQERGGEAAQRGEQYSELDRREAQRLERDRRKEARAIGGFLD